jgi:ABC-type transport system involved in multi-copper enzyme maturation permease subunit
MLGTIFRREVLDHLKSARFQIALLITAVLAVTTALINVQDYAVRRQNYLDAQQELKSEGFAISVFREPQVLGILVRGKDRDLGDQARISYMSVPTRLTGYLNVRQSRSPSLAQLGAVDFSFLVRVILSLLVVFLAYGSVSEEKANGTLRLVMANPLPRDKLLLGKALAGLLVVFGVLAVAALLSLIVVASHPAVSLSGGDLIRVLLMLACSALYLCVFYTLALFVSVRTDKPAVSLMVLLQVWIVLVVLYPNLSVRVAEHVFPLPSDESVLAQRGAVSQRFQPEIGKANEGLSRPSPTSEDRLRSVEAWSAEAAEMAKIDAEFSRRQSRQRIGAEFLSLLSPAAIYDQAVTRLARTDIPEYDRFMEGVRRLWDAFVERFKLRITDPETAKRTSLPDFSYRSDPPAAAVASTWPKWLLLFLFNLILFALAATGFLRKDLR